MNEIKKADKIKSAIPSNIPKVELGGKKSNENARPTGKKAPKS